MIRSIILVAAKVSPLPYPIKLSPSNLSTNNSKSANNIRQAGKLAQQANRKLISQLRQNTPKNLDDLVHDMHDAVFSKTDCLQCANCCKTTSPIFYQKDIERLAKRLRIRPVNFISTYLTLDTDNDYVLKSAPCPFLETDNRCAVYDDRPTACRTYPHTDRKRFYQVLELTYENSFVCPAVQDILTLLGNRLNLK
jgi:Fe-S-cluster containining protein